MFYFDYIIHFVNDCIIHFVNLFAVSLFMLPKHNGVKNIHYILYVTIFMISHSQLFLFLSLQVCTQFLVILNGVVSQVKDM